jgi:hypothetical protein
MAPQTRNEVIFDWLEEQLAVGTKPLHRTSTTSSSSSTTSSTTTTTEG